VIIHDFHIVRTCFPAKAKPPLVVDSNAVLAFPVSEQGLKPIARWDA
jgi:hypothetical protein